MRYFDEMNDKHGFSDGEAVPVDAEACRTVYCQVLNKLLERFGSLCRIIPFDRVGVHNWCLWLCIPVESYLALTPEQRQSGDNLPVDEVPGDEAWDRAVAAANEMELDGCVKIEINADELDVALKEAELSNGSGKSS